MTNIPVTCQTEKLRLLGRMDRAQVPPALDWTGSGVEFTFRGSDCWAELEAPAASPIFWMAVLADGCPVARFPVEPGCRFYPLLLGMEKDQSRCVTLLKETQCMPPTPEATVLLRTLRLNGELLELPHRDYRIEFIGDSLTSGEGVLAPRDNPEWITPWFSAFSGYAALACRELNAEYRILSQSGYGVCWDWAHKPEGNMTDGYELNVGVLHGPAAEARGCRKPCDFAAWQPDLVCIRLLTNDCGGVFQAGSLEEDRPAILAGCLTLLRKVRAGNPKAKILWILPGTAHHPELAEEAVDSARRAGMDELYTFALPDYGPADYGARQHPNADWNRKAARLLADYLKTIL
ncbi:MAG: hypothetical protein IJI21_04435 [Clostridia bacterium]|nr:hypothetical protein [Clostridia bacterium]